MKIKKINFDRIKLSGNPFYNCKNKNPNERIDFALNTLPQFKRVRQELQDVSSTLENYAKANDIKIKFIYDPSSSNEADHQLNVIVTDDSFLTRTNTIYKTSVNPDVDFVETVKVNDKLTSEDTFLKRVYRAVSDLTSQLNTTRKDIEMKYLESLQYTLIHDPIRNLF